ncbi:PhzF family phenazine biosynthesis protein [Nocardioides mangrovicus]|uniref:PhzF family phenazine biosynthesis protein n=1 Tax=Nocardioides mangrovicus TaxID=2478913 RepID=A0A3L8P7C5_9ACTN|nr:PhzF family phenazine biosynthesis protein [Nocardioides mangrovicus]RLV50842.1 PhzF family phenazine biosynthesis protein [Nocardioides mangrovicus]
MRSLPYDVVDVFADEPFSGNQLAVVHGAAGLDDATLLAVTREFGFSETAFPEPVGAAGYRVRIFTPGGEIPFAGHPTLGTAWVLRQNGELREDEVVQTCGAGEVGVRFLESAGLVELTATPRTLEGPLTEEVAGLARGVGLEADDVVGPAWRAGAGLDFSYLPVRPDAVARARPGTDSDVDVYAVTPGDPVRVHSRVFVADLAVPEDPATGSAAAGLGIVLAASGVLPDGGDVEIAQGAELGRPSRLFLTVEARGGVADRVRVAGRVFATMRGTLDVPG